MAKFTGVKCPVCNLPFAADDDIVVCPDCGTPHHRPCWESEGQCANTARHATGYEFAAPEADSTIACPGCGTACRESQHFCEHCGTRLLPDEVEKPAENPAYQPVFGQPATLGGDSASTPIYGSFAPGDPALTEQLDDYTLPEWANFIGPNAGYYILAFKRAKALGRYPFCWSAFFFAPVYFWFRKMWGWGALAGLCNIILSLPTLLINYSQLYGTTLPIPLSTLEGMITPFAFASVLVNFLWGYSAFSRYFKFAKEKMAALKALQLPNIDYNIQLQRVGGTSIPVAIAAGGLLLFFFFNIL